MGSSGKKKTTMAKLTRESKLRERRVEKQARKQARKQASADRQNGVVTDEAGELTGTDDQFQPVVPAPGDASAPARDASAPAL